MGKLKRRMLCGLFGAFGMKETKESLRLWRCLFSDLKIFSLGFSIWDKGSFHYSSFNVVEFVDGFCIECV